MKSIFVVAITLRLLIILYSIWHDNTFEVKYTDIDYTVFTDASRFVVEGKSPYERHTYRYSPALAYLLLPNILLFESFGKFLFCFIDIVIGFLIYKMQRSKFYSGLYLFNFIIINISTRGNADQLVVFFVLLCLYYLETNIVLSAIFYGISVHLKIYPIIYSITFFLSIKTWKKKLTFTFISAFTCLFLILIFYLQYGYEFLYETYLYHLGRSDNRHNFSVYFYQIYLEYDNFNQFSKLVFIPQLFILVLMAVRFYDDVFFAIFIQTFTFVTFNKVMTVQYFVWFLSLLSFVLPKSNLKFKKLMFMLALWICSQTLWLNFAYKLEFLGENTFLEIWVSGLFFFCSNVYIIIEFIINQ
eukprot:gene12091-5584_t